MGSDRKKAPSQIEKWNANKNLLEIFQRINVTRQNGLEQPA
jgi:hypothetical protein